MLVDAYLVYKFVKLLVTPFSSWPAYRHGIIDQSGRVVRKRKTLRRQDERDSWTLFDVLVANIKKMLARVPGLGGRLASIAAAAFLVKESDDKDEAMHDALEECLDEEVPTNSSSSGQVKTFEEPVKGKKGLKPMGRIPLTRKRMRYLTKALPETTSPTWLATLERVCEEHDADIFQSQKKDSDYHPAVRFKGKEYHAKRPDWHSDLIYRVQREHKLTDDQVNRHIERGTIEMGLKHKKTGRTIWQFD